MNVPTLLTYPARPVNGGRLGHALPKIGLWSYEPKYNGWRAIVHVPTGAMWNRHGKRLTIEAEFGAVLQRLRRAGLEWLDVEALERRHHLGRGSLIILDCPDSKLVYQDRVKGLYDQLVYPCLAECLAQTLKPQNNRLYIPPVYGASELKELWGQLQQFNKSVGCDFYEGVVAKRVDSVYPVQLNSSSQTTPAWMKHRFIL